MDLRQSGIFAEVIKNVYCIGLIVTVIAFKLLRLIFNTFQAVYWRLNGTENRCVKHIGLRTMSAALKCSTVA